MENGYYWVKINGVWEVAYYYTASANWKLCGAEEVFYTDDFEEVCPDIIPIHQ
jgi:hypothetical protein